MTPKVLLVGALALAVLASAVPAQPSTAYPYGVKGDMCDGTEDDVTFRFLGTWTTTEEDLVLDAADEWEDVNELNGTLVTFNENPTSWDWTIVWINDLGSLGSANCKTGIISIDTSVADSYLRGVVLHEIGHTFGLNHTGISDTHDSNIPAMATCITTTQMGNNEVAQDDAGALTRIHGFSSTADTIHANAGFERGTLWWGKTSVSDFYSSSSSSEDGIYNLRFRPTAAYGYVYQTMNYDVAGGEIIDARTNIKKISSSSTTGKIKLQILTRTVSYGSASGCAVDQYETDRDQNDRNPPGAWYVRGTEYKTPTTSWAMLTEATTYTLPGDDNFDVRVRVGSFVRYTSNNSYALIALDTTRGRDRST